MCNTRDFVQNKRQPAVSYMTDIAVWRQFVAVSAAEGGGNTAEQLLPPLPRLSLSLNGANEKAMKV